MKPVFSFWSRFRWWIPKCLLNISSECGSMPLSTDSKESHKVVDEAVGFRVFTVHYGNQDIRAISVGLLFVRSCASLQVEELIKQNNAIDIYEEYFQGSVVDHSSEQPYAKTLTVFRDPAQQKGVRRSSSYISWWVLLRGLKSCCFNSIKHRMQRILEGCAGNA